jgi:hypothetical protein
MPGVADLPTTMITRSQQSGLLIIMFAFIVYVFFRVR